MPLPRVRAASWPAHPPSTTGAGCIPGDSAGGAGNLIDGNYKTPYAIHISGGVQHAFNQHWTISADYTHEEGNHAYRAYSFTGGTNLFTPLIPASDPNYASDQAGVVPDLNLFKSDNRSSYNALMLRLQGNVSHRFNLTANYTLSSENLGMPARRTLRLCERRLRSTESFRARGLRALRRGRHASLRPRRNSTSSGWIRVDHHHASRERAPLYHHQRNEHRTNLGERSA